MKSLLKDSIITSYIDKTFPSSPVYHAELLINDYERGVKILHDLQKEIRTSKEIYISVAFITDSGLAVLANELLYAMENEIPIYLLTSDYLFFNKASVFKKLLQFPNIQTKIIEGKALHNKAFIFKKDSHINTMIGSANLTAKALTQNQEWNFKFSSLTNGQITSIVLNEFFHLWEQATLVTQKWIDSYELSSKELAWVPSTSTEQTLSVTQTIIPNKMQTEALKNLDRLRSEGKNKALLISSTGTGKTYLSAFDVRNFNPKRILFVIHREQIAIKAMNSFQQIMPEKNYGLLSGKHKDFEADYLFTTIQTLSKRENFSKFSPTHFDYIIIDEAHHSEAQSYQKIIEYFRPTFLLGMTATPERTDGEDIYQYFDHNIAYEIRLQEALREDMLCPFHYYGVVDITVNNETIDENTHFLNLTHEERIKHIIKYINFYGFSGNRVKGLMFVSRNDEAEALSKAMNQNGFNTIALSGKNSQEDRELAIERLTKDDGDLDYIITVDIFNEGVDIPEVNQIVMLRPTQSAIVFVQQLGRGLRKEHSKEYLVVIDFIGNYQNNFLIPIALSGDTSYNKENLKKFLIEGNNTIPGTSTVHFDEKSQAKIYEAITTTNFSQIKFLKEKYLELKYKIGRMPRLVDFLNYDSIDPQIIFKHPKFNNYYDFLEHVDLDELTPFSYKLSDYEKKILSWISLEFSNGKRKQELLIFKDLFEYGKAKATNYFDSDQSKRNLLSIFSLDFYVKSDRKKYGGKPIIILKNGYFYFNESIQHSLESNPTYLFFIKDIIDYGLMRNKMYYSENIVHHELSLFEQYSKKDACRLLLWENDEKGTIYGYRFKYNTFPIFVTYHKSESISQSIQYDDKFIDRKFFSWMSRNNRTLESQDILELKRAQKENIPVDLFIQKDDEEENQYFYIGPMKPVEFKQTTIRNDKGDELPIVNVIFELKEMVRKDLFDYFTEN